MSKELPQLFILIILCGHIGVICTQDYNYEDYFDDYVDAHGCGWREHFCTSTDTCNNASEACDGQCGRGYRFCHSTGRCIDASEFCDGQCSEDAHFCPFTDSCIPMWYACDGNCPDDYPHLCDNRTRCYSNSDINDGWYSCRDENDEYRPTGEPCGGIYYIFCPSINSCLKDSEACDGKCGENYHFCPSSISCLHDSEACDGLCGGDFHFCRLTGACNHGSDDCDRQCGRNYYFCPSTDSCIDKYLPCAGNCSDDYPNLCDNGTLCYPNGLINDRRYNCVDRSDEHRPTEESPPLDNSSLDKFLQLNTGEDENGHLGVDCQDGTVHAYLYWCKEDYSRMCGAMSTTDYLICHNSSLWKDRPCGGFYGRGCKVPGKCIYVSGECNGDLWPCGASDYSVEVCPMNEDNLKKQTRYFRCKDNSTLIHPTLVCDGFKHCGDSSDENECDICPRVNNMVVHSQVVQLETDEIRDLAHLRSTAIMRCESPYGQSVCATPGDGVAECTWQLKEGLWQNQDEVELTSATLWKTIFKFMSYIFLMSVVILFKITQLEYLFQKPTINVPVLTSYHRTIPLDDEPLPLAIPMRSFTAAESSFPTPFFTTTEPMQLTQQFRQYYIRNHTSECLEEFFNFCLTLSQFLPTRKERDIFHCGIYAIEAQIHGMSPTCTDRCLKQHSSGALEPMFEAVYGSFSDSLPDKVKDGLFTKDKVPSLQYLLRIKTFLVRYFFFYYDIVQEYVLLSFILGTAGLGISTTTWLEISDFDYFHIIVYLYIISAFLPMVLFGLQLSFSSQIGIIFGVKKPSGNQRIFFGFCCFTLSPFIPTVLFFKMEKQQIKMINIANRTSKTLSSQSNKNSELVSLKNDIVAASKILINANDDITVAKSLYKQLKEWELAIEMPIQSSLTIIFSFMKKSTTVVNQVFQNWFISDATSLIFLIGMSLRSFIAVQISDESARRNNFLGIKSKMLLAPLYMMTSIPRITSIVIYAAVPLGLLDLLGHWTVERQGNGYVITDMNTDGYNLADCLKDSGYKQRGSNSYSSLLFSADVSSTKYTTWNTPTYVAILMVVLLTSVSINFIWLCFLSKKTLSEKILSSAKSALSITIDSDFDEDDESVRPEQLHLHYEATFTKVHKEYILKLLLHTGTNMALTFPWALAYQAANERHQVLSTIGDCYGVKGTVEMEDISLERLWWGQWVLPLVMAVLGIMNYGWFRLYVKYGHPWRRLLTPDNERIGEWRTLKLWEMLENQNDNGGEIGNGDDLNMREMVPVVSVSDALSVGEAGRDMAVCVNIIENQEGDSSNRDEKFQKEKMNMGNAVSEVLICEKVEEDVHYQREMEEDDDINMKNEFNGKTVTMKDDISMALIDDRGGDVVLELQVDQEGDAGRREELHKPKLKRNNGNKDVDIVVSENLMIGNDNCVEFVNDNDANEVAKKVIENLSPENRDKEKKIDKEHLQLKGNERKQESEKEIEKVNVSTKFDLCVKTVCDNKNNEMDTNKIQRENVSLKINLYEEQMVANNVQK